MDDPKQPSSLTTTSVLTTHIEGLGGPVEELDPEIWGDVSDRVLSLANELPAVPTFPAVATRVLAMARDPKLDMNKLSNEIQCDAAMVTTLLRVANSAAFAPASPILATRAAVQMLGIKQVIEIVVGGSAQGMYKVASKADIALFPDLWPSMFKEAMGNAFLASRIALDVRGASIEQALLAGLLVDVGRPIALRIMSNLIQKGMPRPEDAVITAVLDDVALEIGGRTVSKMGLPPQLVTACTPDRNASNVDSVIAQLVAALGAVQRRSPRIWVNAEEARKAAETLKLTPPVVRSLFAQRTTYVEQAASMFGR